MIKNFFSQKWRQTLTDLKVDVQQKFVAPMYQDLDVYF